MRVTIVDACVRPGRGGGSPTAVVVDGGTQTDGTLTGGTQTDGTLTGGTQTDGTLTGGTLTDDERQRVPARYGTSHAAFIGPELDGSHAVRFFTTKGELTGCGHGTIAAQAVRLAEGGPSEARQRTGGRTFDTRSTRRPDGIEVWFDQGIIAVRPATPDDCEAVLAAVGIGAAQLHPYVRMVVASPGTPRLLVPVADRDMLAALTPDFAALGSATRERGLLGCFAYVPPGWDRPAVARMFAPAIGVDEDVANANSTGCLAAHLRPDRPIEVEQGDALGRPATVSALVHSGRVWVGGLAVIRGSDLG